MRFKESETVEFKKSTSELRETIINAFCHRDYREYDSVNIAVFKDRVEIRSPGLLYGDLTIEKITTEMVSERRNELIADLFHRIHLIEKWGRGINLILSKEPTTRFKEVGTHFVAVFKRKGISEDETSPQDMTQKTVEKTVEKIFSLIKANPQITQREIMDQTGLTRRGVEWNLKKLKDKKRIRRIGPDKGGHWLVRRSV